MPSISYAITACNEHVELERLLDLLNEYIRPEDEIVVQLDSNATKEVEQIAIKYNIGTKYDYHRVWYPLNNDFGAFKNHLSGICSRDYIFQIDADEYPHPELIVNLPAILEANSDTDVFLIPRINTVEGLTEEHIRQWGWRVENNRVNFPDYQWRLWKHKKGIHWINKVHERLEGYQQLTNFPPIDEMCLFHPKDIIRQEKQNNYYNTL
jgi:cellulose synthase/poly-beta-1,6-N-acetylglucosamine synthase-like glycosyltransferase